MNDDQLTGKRLADRMQEVLDGTASRADTRALHALLARDADAAEEFAAWTAMFDGLSTLPMVHPPEGLVAAIDAAIPHGPVDRTADTIDGPEKIVSDTFQLFPDESVLGSGITQSTRRPFGFKTIASWLVPASSRESHNMNTQQKVLAGGAAAIVALGLAAVLAGYPPKSTDVVGTVVPAERYRAPQSGAEAVKLGEQSAIASTGTSIDASGPAAANIEADRAAFMAEADKMSKLSEADRAAYLSQLDKVSKLSQADRAAYLSQADRSMAQAQADNMGKLSEADRVAMLAQADKMSRLSEADRAAYLSQLDKVSRLSQADRAAFLSQADRSMAQSQADKMGKLSEADRIALQAQADRMSKLSEADRAAYLSQMDKVSRLSEADRAASLSQAEKMGKLNAADRIAMQAQADKMSKLSEADRAAYLSQLDKVSRLSQADRAAYLSQADRSMAQSQADRAANRVDQADKASANMKN